MTANIMCLHVPMKFKTGLNMILFRAAMKYKNKFKIAISAAQFAIDIVRKKKKTQNLKYKC